MLIQEEIEVNINSKTMKYYKSLGYSCKTVGEKIFVKIKDLKKYSRERIKIKCDYCGKEMEKPYCDWIKGQSIISKDCCPKCKGKKMEEISQKLYGTNNVFQSEIIKTKIAKTIKEKYGVENISCSEEIKQKKENTIQRHIKEEKDYKKNIRDKREKTNIKLYGKPYKQQTEEFQRKKKLTCLEKYGFEYASSSVSVKNKVRETIKNKYGYENCSQIPEVKQKVLQSRFKANNFICSRPQKQIWEYIGGVLNYPYKCFCFDIFFEEEGIVIEYNGSGHDLSVKNGNISLQKFQAKEKFREKTILEAGYKIMYMVSLRDKIPTKEKILKLYNFGLEAFKIGYHKIVFNFDEEEIVFSNLTIPFNQIL